MLARLVELERDQLAVLMQDQHGIRQREGHLRRDHAEQRVRQTVGVHQPGEGDHQEGRRNGIDHQRDVADRPSPAQPQAPDREARERADAHRERHRPEADDDAVAELAPEMFEQPVLPGPDHLEPFEGKFAWPYDAIELFGVVGEGEQQHVVDRQQRPEQHDHADRRRRSVKEPSPAARAACRRALMRAARQGKAHSCTSVACSLRSSRMATGMVTGSTDSAAARPTST